MTPLVRDPDTGAMNDINVTESATGTVVCGYDLFYYLETGA